jgi:hypothetical protein
MLNAESKAGSKANLPLGDALRLGSAVVAPPHSMEIERCGIGMVYQAHGIRGVRSTDCGTINLIYHGIIDKAWPCPWCEERAEIQGWGLAGVAVIQHPFGKHYLTGQISLEQLAEWLDFIGTDPDWKQLQDRVRAMREVAQEELVG